MGAGGVPPLDVWVEACRDLLGVDCLIQPEAKLLEQGGNGCLVGVDAAVHRLTLVPG